VVLWFKLAVNLCNERVFNGLALISHLMEYVVVVIKFIWEEGQQNSNVA